MLCKCPNTEIYDSGYKLLARDEMTTLDWAWLLEEWWEVTDERYIEEEL